MFKILLIFAVIGRINSETTKWGVDSADGVVVLNDNNFDKFLSEHDFVMVKFYVQSCSHCQKMASEYSALAKKVDSDTNNRIAIAELDGDANKKVAAQQKIQAYPTIKYYYHGHSIDYHGERTVNKIEEWLLGHMEERIKEVNTLQEVKEIELTKLAVLLYLPNKNSKTIKALNALALSYENLACYYTYSDEIQSYMNLIPQNSLIVFRDFDEGKKILSNENDLSFDLMKQFFDSIRLPLILEFDDEVAKEIFTNQNNAIFFFSENADSPQFKVFYQIANSNKNNYKFIRFSAQTGIGKKLAIYFGVDKRHKNQIRAIKFYNNEVSKFMLEDVTEESLAKFLNDYTANSLPKYLKSQDPIENDTGLVKTVVSQNFEELVLNNDKYILLEGYAPWCKHCKKLEPVYAKLADKVKHVPNLVIAKYDGSANEHPSFQVKGFPTIKFYMKGKKFSPIEYNQPRDLKSLLAFVQSQMGNDWMVETITDDSL